MTPVCGACKGTGLANYYLLRALRRRTWCMSAQGSGGSPFDFASAIGVDRLCRTCHGRGVEGLEEVDDLVSYLLTRLREQGDDHQNCAVNWRKQLSANSRLRSELHDLAERAGELEVENVRLRRVERKCKRKAKKRKQAQAYGRLMGAKYNDLWHEVIGVIGRIERGEPGHEYAGEILHQLRHEMTNCQGMRLRTGRPWHEEDE